jgi:hypothetical protein
LRSWRWASPFAASRALASELAAAQKIEVGVGAFLADPL